MNGINFFDYTIAAVGPLLQLILLLMLLLLLLLFNNNTAITTTTTTTTATTTASTQHKSFKQTDNGALISV